MSRISELHKRWMKDAAYRKEYEALAEEFELAAAIAKARSRAGLSQVELARRMKTT
jgi:ribosome-binding protein aMBF1 (putative translation factor)